ncbi:MAG TPA: putative quinol monooxygenase [Candidatus Saccharimonadales bacterium]|nr:putative quinol monooxygenase [Candidatus Saccharimonadales bacterium]
MPKRRAKKKAAPRRPRRISRGAKITKLPKGALTLIVTLRAKDGQHLLLEAELRALIGPTRKEEGCLQYDLHRGADQPGTFLFHEVWASREHHTAHTRTPHFLRWNARKDALLAGNELAFWQQIA